MSVLNFTHNGGKSEALQQNCVEFKCGLKFLVSNLTIIKIQVLEKKEVKITNLRVTPRQI